MNSITTNPLSSSHGLSCNFMIEDSVIVNLVTRFKLFNDEDDPAVVGILLLKQKFRRLNIPYIEQHFYMDEISCLSLNRWISNEKVIIFRDDVLLILKSENEKWKKYLIHFQLCSADITKFWHEINKINLNTLKNIEIINKYGLAVHIYTPTFHTFGAKRFWHAC